MVRSLWGYGLRINSPSRGGVCPKCARLKRTLAHSSTLQRTMLEATPDCAARISAPFRDVVPGLKALVSIALSTRIGIRPEIYPSSDS
jgi:hypothetical protein